MTSQRSLAPVAVIGGGVVGTAVFFTLTHRGIKAVLIESEPDLAYGPSGTNSGMLHTGFDSTPGTLETEMILRSARLRPPILGALGVPVVRIGAQVVPGTDEEHAAVRELAGNARANGVNAYVREGDGALVIPGESITDPVAFTLAMGASAVQAGGEIRRSTSVVGMSRKVHGVRVDLDDGTSLEAAAVINAAGLFADDVARMLGDDSFAIYPRKGEFLVFDPPEGTAPPAHILLPVPTKRTKGIIVFPTLDGRLAAGPTAIDLEDKHDWSVRPSAQEEIMAKAVAQFPALAGLKPVATYVGLRPAGRDGANYIIGVSAACDRLINVAAIRSTGLSASLGIGDHVADIVAGLEREDGVAFSSTAPPTIARTGQPWWQRTSHYRRTAR